MSSDCPTSSGSSDTPGTKTGYPSDCEILEGYRTRAREKNEQPIDPMRQRALSRAKDTKLLLLDVDGVLTDGSLVYSEAGEATKTFNAQDGFGLQLLREAGIEIGLISARKSEVVFRRAQELEMTYVFQGSKKKNDAFKSIIKGSSYKPFEIAYMGDDWLDLVILQQVGFAIAPANGVPEVREVVHFVTKHPGGRGAVREVCDLILEAKSIKEELLQKYKNR